MPDLGFGGMPLSVRQVTSIRDATGRVNIWEGSIRSGKTIASLIRFLMFVADCPPGGQIVVVARTRDVAARNVFAVLQDPDLFGPFARHVIYTPGATSGRILGRTVYVLGASDVKAEKVLRGLTVVCAYVDEVTIVAEEFFKQLLGRMSPAGAKMFGTTNPDNPAHWLKRDYLDYLDPKWRRFHFTLDDNPSLEPSFVESIKREYTGLWYRRFILGEWVAAEGAVFGMWDPDRHIVPWESLPAMERLLCVGVDYGTTNPAAGLLLGYADDRLWLVDEWRHDPKKTQVRFTDAQLSAGLRGWMGTVHAPAPNRDPQIEWVIVDPSAASFKVQLVADGQTNVTDADNDVGYGIRTVSTLLGTGGLKVSDRCQGFIQEAPGYSWDPAATLKGEDKPIKIADHSLDAARYAVVTTEGLWRGRVGDDMRKAA